VSYSDTADTDSVRPILLSARARSLRVTTTERGVAEVDDGVVMVELIQNFVG
jgi:hypothetical protein